MKKITPEIFQDYKQILFFVQKRGDLDSCASTLTLLKLVKAKLPEITLKVIYNTKFNNGIKELEEYRTTRIGDINRKEKKTLGVLCDISSIKEVTNKAFLNYCKDVYVFNHHEGHGDWTTDLINKIIWDCNNTEYSSTCELIWDLIDKEAFAIDRDLMGLLYSGIYSDTFGFTSSHTSIHSFRIAMEMMQRGIDIGKINNATQQISFEYMKLFARVLDKATIHKGRCVFMNLTSGLVRNVLPWTNYQRQTRCFKYLVSKARSNIDADTFILVHYSLFCVDDENKKVVYVITDKPNALTDQILATHGFKRSRNQWMGANMNAEKTYRLFFEKYGKEFGAC